MNWAEFFHMGGYAYYVWSAWGLSFAVLLWQWLQPTLKRKRLINQLSRQIAREQLNLSNAASRGDTGSKANPKP